MIVARKQWTQSLLENHVCTHFLQKIVAKEYIKSQGKNHITQHCYKMAKKYKTEAGLAGKGYLYEVAF